MPNMPSLLFIEEGVYNAEKRYVTVNIPLSIYGAGRDKTTVRFGLLIKGVPTVDLVKWGYSNGIVEIVDLKIQGARKNGLLTEEGMNVIMRDVTVEDCQEIGVLAQGADITCDDLQVVGCGSSGVYASSNATITLSGEGTSIQGNGTKWREPSYTGNVYGLYVAGSSSSIKLVAPLTKEEISTNNGDGGRGGNGGRGCRNYGGNGYKNIVQVQAVEGEIM